MMHTGLVVAHLLVSILLTPHSVEIKTPRVVHSERLIQAVSTETQQVWVGFLLQQSVSFSIRSNGADFFVAADPIPILERAEQIDALQPEAKRALSERRIEQRVSRNWPQVGSVAVCIAPAEETDDSQPTAVFVVAPNFPFEERASLYEMIQSELPAHKGSARIQLLGAVSSEPGSDNPGVALARR